MSRRISSYWLALILAGAVLDGGTLGFRAAWASCGDWLQSHATERAARIGFVDRQVSSRIDAKFGDFYLRDDETVARLVRRNVPLSTPCGPGDPNCSLRPTQPTPAAPAVSSRDMDRIAVWSGSYDSPLGDRSERLSIFCRVASLRRPSDIFRPPRMWVLQLAARGIHGPLV